MNFLWELVHVLLDPQVNTLMYKAIMVPAVPLITGYHTRNNTLFLSHYVKSSVINGVEIMYQIWSAILKVSKDVWASEHQKVSSYNTNILFSVFLKQSRIVIIRNRNFILHGKNIYISFNCVILQSLDLVKYYFDVWLKNREDVLFFLDLHFILVHFW